MPLTVPGQPLREDPPYVWGGGRVGFEPPQPAPPAGVGGVGVGAGVGQSVPVGRAATQIASLLADLGLHRSHGSEPAALDLPFGLGAPAA